MHVVSILFLALAAILFFASDRFFDKNSEYRVVRMTNEYSQMLSLACVVIAGYLYMQGGKADAQVETSPAPTVSDTTTSSPQLSDEVFKNE